MYSSIDSMMCARRELVSAIRERGLASLRHVDQDPVDGDRPALGRMRVRAVEHDALLTVRAAEPVLALDRVAGEQLARALAHQRAVVRVDPCAPRVDRGHRGRRGVDQRLEARRRVHELRLAVAIEDVAVQRLVDLREHAARVGACEPGRASVSRARAGHAGSTRSESGTTRPRGPRQRIRSSADSPAASACASRSIASADALRADLEELPATHLVGFLAGQLAEPASGPLDAMRRQRIGHHHRIGQGVQKRQQRILRPVAGSRARKRSV